MEDHAKLTSVVTRDPFVTIMFCAAIVIVAMNLTLTPIAIHIQRIDLAIGVMALTAVFAIAGIVLGLVRSLRAKHRV